MRIFCPAGVTSQTLRGTGIITLAKGCMMRGDNHLIHSHYSLHSKMELGPEEDEIYVPDANINELLLSNNNRISNWSNITLETHEEQLINLKKKIRLVKEQQEQHATKLAAAEPHHYIMYGFMALCGTMFGIWIYITVRGRRLCLPGASRLAEPKDDMELVLTHLPRDQTSNGIEADNRLTREIIEPQHFASASVRKMDIGTSPDPAQH